MTSRKQLESNRRNALKSTGPRSSEGKAVSSRNALRHGLTAAQIVIAGEDPEEYRQLLDSMKARFAPSDPFESVLVDQLAQQLWRLRRIPLLEAALLNWLQRAELVKDRRALPSLRAGGSTSRLPVGNGSEAGQRGQRAQAAQVEIGGAAFGELYALGRTVERALAKQDYLNKLSRYQTALVRDFDRSLSTLLRLKEKAAADALSSRRSARPAALAAKG